MCVCVFVCLFVRSFVCLFLRCTRQISRISHSSRLLILCCGRDYFTEGDSLNDSGRVSAPKQSEVADLLDPTRSPEPQPQLRCKDGAGEGKHRVLRGPRPCRAGDVQASCLQVHAA